MQRQAHFQNNHLQKKKKRTYGQQLPVTQKWSNYCPPCTLPSPQKCRDLPCQTYNIKACDTYKGIELPYCNPFLKLACQEALFSAKYQKGGPFGAVLVQYLHKKDTTTNNGMKMATPTKVLRYWIAHNQVTTLNDPTAHAEMQVIRKASHDLKRFHLEDCILYSSDEPCSMCSGAVYWARIPQVYFAATRYDAAAPGVNFSDEEIFREMGTAYRKRKRVRFYQMSCPNSLDAFNYWKRSITSLPY